MGQGLWIGVWIKDETTSLDKATVGRGRLREHRRPLEDRTGPAKNCRVLMSCASSNWDSGLADREDGGRAAW